MQHLGEQRPSPADLGLLADEPAPLFQPGLQDAWLVGPPATGRRALMDEDQLALGVDVLLAQREQLLRADPREKRREDQRPVARLDGVEQTAGFLWRHPATLLALACRLQASVGRIDAGGSAGLTSMRCSRKAYPRTAERLLMAPSIVDLDSPRASSAPWMSCRCFRVIWWSGRSGRQAGAGRCTSRCDPLRLDGPRVATDTSGPDAHPLAEGERAFGHVALVEFCDVILCRPACRGLGRMDADLPLEVLAVAVCGPPARDLALGVADRYWGDRACDADGRRGPARRSVIAAAGRVGGEEALDLGGLNHSHRC